MNNKNHNDKQHQYNIVKVRDRRRFSRKREKQNFQKYLREEIFIGGEKWIS